MHELSLCQAIAKTATAHAGGRSVWRISLQIGHLRQVVPETLQQCWIMHSARSSLAGSVLEIDEVPASIDCNDCSETTRLDEPILRCGACGAIDVVLATGDEFLILSIDVSSETETSEHGQQKAS